MFDFISFQYTIYKITGEHSGRETGQLYVVEEVHLSLIASLHRFRRGKEVRCLILHF